VERILWEFDRLMRSMAVIAEALGIGACHRLSAHARPEVPDCKYANGSNHNQEHCCIRPRDVKHRKTLPAFSPRIMDTD
jgi:hypothetical protein